MPALLGHLLFASDQPWFWKHMLIQCVMGTASTFLPAYTLATLHEVSIVGQASTFQLGSTANAGRRLVGGREGFEAGSSAPPWKLAFILTNGTMDTIGRQDRDSTGGSEPVATLPSSSCWFNMPVSRGRLCFCRITVCPSAFPIVDQESESSPPSAGRAHGLLAARRGNG